MTRGLSRRHVLVFAAVVLAATALAAPSPSFATWGGTPVGSVPDNLVVVVLAPYLTWTDVTSGEMPNLARLAERAMLADTNVSSGLRRPSADALDQGALSLSAGVWVEADSRALPPASVGERIQGGTAAALYRRLTGVPAGEAGIVHLGYPRHTLFNKETSMTSVLGILGGAVRRAGGRTVAVGNSDPGADVSPRSMHRPAAAVAMDEHGRVDAGDVSSRLLRRDSEAPFGVSTDMARLLQAFRESIAEVSAGRSGAPVLAVIDPGDLHRAMLFASDAAPERVEAARRRALRALDQVVGAVSSEGVSLFVVAPAAARHKGRTRAFAPLLVAPADPGSGAGVLTSSSTHREGLVTLLDVAATVLDTLGIERPVQMVGNEMEFAEDGSTLDARISRLDRMERTATAVDTPKGYFQGGYIVLAVLVFLVATLLLIRREPPGGAGRVVRALLLLVLAIPVSGSCMFVFAGSPGTAAEVAVLFTLAVLALTAVSLAVGRLERGALPVAFVSGVTVLVLLVDQWLGGPWSFTGLFGFSPVLGARYYGMGNEGASMLVGALLVSAALAIDLAPERLARPARHWGFALLGTIATITVAAPFLGANVGVAIWGTIAVGVAWAGMNGRPLGWKGTLAILAAVVLLIGAFSLLDLDGGAGQTHLGRAWESAGKGGVGELWTIAARKAETNLRVLTRTNWSYLLFVILGLLAYMRARPQGVFRGTLEAYPAFAAAMTAGLAGGLFGYLTEDSGIVIPALVMLYVGGAALYLMLGRRELEGDAST